MKRRRLYRVYVVDPATELLLLSGYKVIAKSEESAKFKALSSPGFDCDIDDLDIFVEFIGELREEKSVQEVRVIE